MNVNELRDLIETIGKRIDGHRNELKDNEALTRYALVDPLLRGMGWDTGDPEQVRPEYPVLADGTRADYVLLGDNLDTPDTPALIPEGQKSGRPAALLIEAKSLFRDSDAERELRKAALQAEYYSSCAEVRYFAATDGQRWHVYDRKIGGGLAKRQIKSFDLKDEKAYKDCEQAKELWRKTWHIEFVRGYRVDPDGKVRSPEDGKVTKRFKKRRPYGTRWILDGRFLDAAGRVLTPMGNPSLNFEYPCPPDTAKIENGKFLDADGKEIRPRGRRR